MWDALGTIILVVGLAGGFAYATAAIVGIVKGVVTAFKNEWNKDADA